MAELTELTCGQGESFKVMVTLLDTTNGTPLDITNYTFNGQIRENYTTDEVAAAFTITPLPPYSSGSIYIQLSTGQTSTLTQRKYVYDIYFNSGSIAPTSRRLLEGQFTVRPSATR